jgi:hypothetical protein
MGKTIPISKSIIGYREIYSEDAPKNRIELLNGLCRNVVLGEIAGLKYRLKPKEGKYHDTSAKFQHDTLFYFCGSNKNLFAKFDNIVKNYFNYKGGIIFTRPLCLYAFEEIRNSNLPVIPKFTMRHSWELLLKYLLAVNNEITKLAGAKNLDTYIEEKEVFNLETLNPKLLPLNELNIDIDPLYVAYRGYGLLEYLSRHIEMASLLKSYFKSEYNIQFDRFIYEIMGLYLANNKGGVNNIINERTGEVLDTSFYYTIKNSDKKLLNSLSKDIKNKKPERLLATKKYPFYKIDERTYLLVDNVLLIEKMYNQFINDFWFDKVKLVKNNVGIEIYSIDGYRSIIGYFFEKYTQDIIKYSFANALHWKIKTFNELNVLKEGNQIELADVFIRHNNKVFLGQVKSTGLYDTEKYAGDINKFYKNDRNKFFESFGIGQLITSIKNFEDTVEQIDMYFNINKRYKIYPAIIVNEKALQTPVMAQIFNQRFQELSTQIKRNNKMTIYPLAVIHISDLEQMEESLTKDANLFWRILDYNKRNPKFIPPFYNTLNNLKIKPTYERISNDFFDGLITKFQTDINP